MTKYAALHILSYPNFGVSPHFQVIVSIIEMDESGHLYIYFQIVAVAINRYFKVHVYVYEYLES